MPNTIVIIGAVVTAIAICFWALFFGFMRQWNDRLGSGGAWRTGTGSRRPSRGGAQRR